MIRSMTGFGSAVVEYQLKTISVEIKSVNSKFFDLTLRLPQIFKEKEMELRMELARFIERGKAEVSFNIESQDVYKKVNINKPLLKAYYEELRKIDEELNIPPSDYMPVILSIPEVLIGEKLILSDAEWQAASSALALAMKNFQNFRHAEGNALERDLTQRIHAITEGIKDLAQFEAQRIEIVKKRLQNSLEEFIQVNNIDRNRLEQELIFYIEKFDISEEKVRLATHCKYFLETLNDDSSGGKKLSFISQEIGREINTIGSKANDAGMQKIVVLLKDELEKIKEQVLNVL
jgi:uncharacterized protein (TIGR00255 family)